jgi:hypothetical protein
MLKSGTEARNQERFALGLPPKCATNTDDLVDRRYRVPTQLCKKVDRGLFDKGVF